MSVKIIGAGIAGLTCAVALAEKGIKAELYERGPTVGAPTCSWYAGGMLAPWCERESAEEIVVTQGVSALSWWAQHASSVQQNGTLVLAAPRDVADLTRFSRRTSEYEWVDEARIAALEPDLAGRFRKGLFFPQEGHLNPREAMHTLYKTFVKLGGVVHFNTELPEDYQKSAYAQAEDIWIDCRGLPARQQLKDLRGVRGEMLLLKTSEISFSRPVRLLHPRIPLYIVPRGEGIFMVGATMIESDSPGEARALSIAELLNGAYTIHPAFGEAEILELGSGVRPAFADNIPKVIHQTPHQFYINGMHRHGYLLAPWLAQQTALSVSHLLEEHAL
ncbi:glycine oxidase ThiO [Entomobacter blattae]|uniref:tRNA 5-methylaminomethyl-2-thiouridine biosynthesis bifunctional protein MnmC n=1 Tax=Entomobacter blattae TaxID=2762277 RepID=A0A7H1NRF9_9PROT|nr:glycine oxidase ThiO [Entomobacter blattae]QNT78369.1 tRNA 5-methylaminomethyl-2-thiouridine biosynthesis bifunctional protein MnmC [Entomobacter blattae]